MPTTAGTTSIDHGWHHYTYVRAGADHKIFLDAVQEIHVTGEPMAGVGPATIVVYTDVLPNYDVPTAHAFATLLTGTKMWEAALTATEIAAEMADYPLVRTANAYQQAPLADASDLTDRAGNNNDWHLDANETGTLDTSTDGPNTPMTSSVTPHLAGNVGIALAITENMPLNFSRVFTLMGWWKVPDDCSNPVQSASLFRFANDDNPVGGAGGPGPQIAAYVDTGHAATRKIILTLENALANGGSVAIAATPAAPAAPAPSTVHLAATVTTDATLAVNTYTWSQVSGPAGPTISTPAAAATDVVFPTYTPGVYVFQVDVTTTNVSTGNPSGPLGATITVVLPETTGMPSVRSGNALTTYPTGVHLAPTIVDDGWHGSLTYAWTQVSGPGVATIVTPAAAATDLTFPAAQGVYVFQLAVTNVAATGIGLWRVTVLTGDSVTVPSDAGSATTFTIDGVASGLILDSPTITETLSGQPNTCAFKVDGATTAIAEGQKIVLTRGGRRLFAGTVMRARQSTVGRVGIQLLDVQVNGPEWEMARRHITQVFENMSASEIGWALVDLVPGFDASLIPAGLPTIKYIAFDRLTIPQALTALAARIPDAHWNVDYFNVVELNTVSARTPAPLPVTVSANVLLANFASVRDLARTVNRLRVTGQSPPHPAGSSPQSSSTPITELEVPSPDDYSAAGGQAELHGITFTYTGLEMRLTGSIAPGAGVVIPVSVNCVPMPLPGGQLAAGSKLYNATLLTATGETTWIAEGGTIMFAPNNACQVRVLVDPYGTANPEDVAKIRGVNLYRLCTIDGHYHLVTSFGARGGEHVDQQSEEHELIFGVLLPMSDTSGTPGTAGSNHYFLTGVSGLTAGDLAPLVDGAKYVFEVNDLASQAELAARFGGGDDGVIEEDFDAGVMTAAQAQAAAEAKLAAQAFIDVQVQFETFDAGAHPGGHVTVSVDDERNVIDNFKIQQTTVTNFASGIDVPTVYHVTATKKLPLVRFESFLVVRR